MQLIQPVTLKELKALEGSSPVEKIYKNNSNRFSRNSNFSNQNATNSNFSNRNATQTNVSNSSNSYNSQNNSQFKCYNWGRLGHKAKFFNVQL